MYTVNWPNSVHCKLAQQCTVCTECTEVSGSCLACDQAPRERGCAALLTHCQQWSTEAVLNSTALTSSTDCLVSGIVLNTHYWVTTASSLRQGDSEKEGAIKTLVSHQLWGRGGGADSTESVFSKQCIYKFAQRYENLSIQFFTFSVFKILPKKLYSLFSNKNLENLYV